MSPISPLPPCSITINNNFGAPILLVGTHVKSYLVQLVLDCTATGTAFTASSLSIVGALFCYENPQFYGIIFFFISDLLSLRPYQVSPIVFNQHEQYAQYSCVL